MKPYWFIKHPKKIREASDCKDFMNAYNRRHRTHFKLVTATHERPDCLAVDTNKNLKLAIEMTMLFDDDNVVKHNLKHADPHKWVRTNLTKQDVYDTVVRKDKNSFEALPADWESAKKILVIDIDKAYDTDGLLTTVDEADIKSLNCKNIEAVYLFYHGTPGRWEYKEYLTRQ